MSNLNETEKRPNPDVLLDNIKDTHKTRGKLKIFFGYAAGVGKTYAMLDDAQEQLKNGIDVLVGYVEPHTRPETLNLLEGLPSLPPKNVIYKNIELKEFDLDAALKRKPELILVDELAHSNAEGVRNKKRYQDIEELLNAGIDVYTTVNVQHIESLNNVVGDITKITVHETVPDYIFDRADKVKIIDIEPDELLRRFEEGKIYRPERARTAMNNFFTKENLRLLREIAMRKAADRISHENQTVRHMSEKMANSKLLVCVSHSPSSAKCIRWAARMAEAFYIPWAAVYVESQDPDSLTEEEKKTKRSNIELAEKLGAEIVTLSGVDVAVVIAEYAKLSGITNIVIGKSQHKKLFKEDLEDQLIGLLPNIEIHIIPNYKKNAASGFGLRRKLSDKNIYFSWSDSFKTILFLILATGISYELRAIQIGDQNLIMVYILSVLLVSRMTKGHIYGIVSSVLSVLTYYFIFAGPNITFSKIAPGYPLTFLIMLLVALVTSTLTARIKTQAKLAVKREQRTETLYEISKKLLATRGLENIIKLTNENIIKLFNRSVIFYTNPETDDGHILQAPKENAAFLKKQDEKAVANWAFMNQKQAGTGTDTLMGAGAFYMPVISGGKSLGVLGISCEKGRLSQNSRFFLQLIASQVAMALERQALSDEQRFMIVESEKERMRSNLLRAISHDLRTPLTGILGASSAILESDDTLDEATRKKLISNIKDDSGWLIRMVENLLSVTRISEGTADVKKTPEAVEEIISESVSRIHKRFPERSISVKVPDKLLIVPMDGILIEQVIMNLVENAIKHSPDDSVIEINVKKSNRKALFEVIDSGEGIANEDLPYLFDGYVKSSKKGPDSSRGIGIGLSICKSIIEAHNGKIEAANKKTGSGAIFRFSLPL
ncbi:MAG: sensor histidine kinase KdpD [Bacillota bacterium]|nr:sensor histidine kinase KdpD [Bacillota bacterium]